MRAVLTHDPSLPSALIDQLWSNPDQLIATATMLKDGDRCTVVRLDINGRSHVLKRYNLKGPFHTAVHWFMRSRARWCWHSGLMLLSGGLLTPRPLAFLEERQFGVFRRRSYLLSEFVPGVSLRQWIDQGKHESRALHAIANQFCHAWRELSVRRLGHGDMKATNFMVDPQGRLWLIDLDGMRTYPRGLMLRAERRKDIVRFMRNWQGQPEVAAAFRARIGIG